MEASSLNCYVKWAAVRSFIPRLTEGRSCFSVFERINSSKSRLSRSNKNTHSYSTLFLLTYYRAEISEFCNEYLYLPVLQNYLRVSESTHQSFLDFQCHFFADNHICKLCHDDLQVHPISGKLQYCCRRLRPVKYRKSRSFSCCSKLYLITQQ